MRKQILTAALLAALAVPAVAQTSTYDSSAGNVAEGANSGVVQPNEANDVGAPATEDQTNSIATPNSAYDQSANKAAEGANSGVVAPGTSNDVGQPAQ